MWQLRLRDKLPHDVAPFVVVAVVAVVFCMCIRTVDKVPRRMEGEGEAACNAACGHLLDKHLWQQAETSLVGEEARGAGRKEELQVE